MTKDEQWEIIRQGWEYVKVANETNARTRRFIQRVDRGDPRVCNPGYENPRYFEKFGYDE